MQFVMQWHPPVDNVTVLSTAALCKGDTIREQYCLQEICMCVRQKYIHSSIPACINGVKTVIYIIYYILYRLELYFSLTTSVETPGKEDEIQHGECLVYGAF